LLRPPASGWHRDQDTIYAATVFAGLESPHQEEALPAFERQAGGQLSAVDAGIIAELRSGYDVRNPLLVQRLEREFLCFDTEGMFPVAFAADHANIESLILSFGANVVFADAATISPALVECLERNGCAFVTDARPGRGEQWQLVDPRLRSWTGESYPAPSSLARRFEDAMEESRAFVEHFIHERPAIAGLASPRAFLDRTVTLAAGVGLAQMAYTLWHEREPTSAVLAFERFHDLEARVQVDAERVRVRPALGRRFLDLREHGLLKDIAGVPWWDGRPIEFAEP
jgi:hypothetical protein